jgi:DNA topoisomerase-1
VDPNSGNPVEAHVGRYGQYVKCGAETRSLPAELSVLDVTLEQALELLAQPKRGRGGRSKVEPLKTFEPSPETGKPIELRDGRYGPYVTDGQTNASIPKDMEIGSVTHDLALRLLADRAARAPRKGAKRTGKKTSRKKASRKQAKRKNPEPS